MADSCRRMAAGHDQIAAGCDEMARRDRRMAAGRADRRRHYCGIVKATVSRLANAHVGMSGYGPTGWIPEFAGPSTAGYLLATHVGDVGLL